MENIESSWNILMDINFKILQSKYFNYLILYLEAKKKTSVLFHRDKRTPALFNPFPPSVPIWHRLAKLSILILEGTIKKISYERRDYKSVDEKSLS